MCLDTVDKVTKKGRGYGYKIFCLSRGELHSELFRWGRPRQECKWYHSKRQREIKATFIGGGSYIPCFHIFLEKVGFVGIARVARRVKYENVVASGEQFGTNVIIARKMYICKGEV